MTKSSPRKATSDDAWDVVRLLAQVPTWRETSVSRWSEDLQQYEEYGVRARRGGWVLELGDVVIAVLTVEWKSPRTIAGRTWPVYLEYLVTDKDHRGGGHGSRLAQYAVRELTRQNCSGAYLKVFKEDDGWEEALRFWERHGWATHPDLTTGTHIVMTKEFAAIPPA